MSKNYKHLSKEERDRLAILRGQGLSIRGIATQLDRSPSTISRELRRNADRSSPDGYCEWMIGTVRRECLDRVIVFDEKHLRRVLKEYLAYYHASRTHLGLEKDAPKPRAIQSRDVGAVASEPALGGLLHRYYREAA